MDSITHNPNHIDNRFSVIVADPPWKYGSRGVRSGRYDGIGYTQMSLEEICAYPVCRLTDKNCALFLWAPSAFLMDAGSVMKCWGFKYCRVEAVWQKTTSSGKPHAACGPWGMTDTEHLLMGTKGKMCEKQTQKRNLYTLVTEPYPGQHSMKPDIFQERIETRFGDIPRIELFARKLSPGWTACGDELCESEQTPIKRPKI